MTATTMLVLVLAGLLGVLLLAHRAEGTLVRALVEYAAVAVLALLLAFTPATRAASAGVTAGVTSGSAALGRLAADAWQRAFGDRRAAGAPAAPAPTRPTPKATRPPRATLPAAPPTSRPAPAPATRPAGRAGVPPSAGVLLLVAVALGGLVALAWRIRRLDRRDPLELGLARLPRGRRRRRAA
jgi:hypothetical protein